MKTPKEEAIKIINEFTNAESLKDWGGMHYPIAIDCSLIVVNKILDTLGMGKLSDNPYTTLEQRQFYVKVKQEIKNLNN